jgi:hypothetical protein
MNARFSYISAHRSSGIQAPTKFITLGLFPPRMLGGPGVASCSSAPLACSSTPSPGHFPLNEFSRGYRPRLPGADNPTVPRILAAQWQGKVVRKGNIKSGSAGYTCNTPQALSSLSGWLLFPQPHQPGRQVGERSAASECMERSGDTALGA